MFFQQFAFFICVCAKYFVYCVVYQMMFVWRVCLTYLMEAVMKREMTMEDVRAILLRLKELAEKDPDFVKKINNTFGKGTK